MVNYNFDKGTIIYLNRVDFKQKLTPANAHNVFTQNQTCFIQQNLGR